MLGIGDNLFNPLSLILTLAGIFSLLKRPKVSISDIKINNKETKSALTNYMREEILFEAETIIKYSGYINRQKEEIDKIKESWVLDRNCKKICEQYSK